jgi:hypothetical protein
MLNWFKKKQDSQVLSDQVSSAINAEPTAESIVFRIKNMAMIDYMKSLNLPEEQMPAGWPLCGDLIVTFGFDMPELFRVVTNKDVDRLGLDANALYGVAMQNLQKQASSVSLIDLKTAYRVDAGGDMDACLLLVPTFWQDMKKNVSGDLIVAVPHRSGLLFTGSADASNVIAMHLAAVSIHDESQDNHALSRILYIFKDDAFEIYRTPEEAGI